ncbi:MAG: thioredoxin family protein [Bacillota bacterium]|nr:thioredoxin family protein [Bacillota bacterium]
MKIEVLGPGCQKCQALLGNVKEALPQAGLEAEIVEVVKVEDVFEIMQRGVNRTPAIIIDGDLKLQGRVATVREILSWITGK